MPRGYLKVTLADGTQGEEIVGENDIVPMDAIYPVWEKPEVKKITIEYFNGEVSELVKE